MLKKQTYKPDTAGSIQGDISGAIPPGTRQSKGNVQLPQTQQNWTQVFPTPATVQNPFPQVNQPGQQAPFLPPSPDGLSQDARDVVAMQNNMMMPSRGFKRPGGDKPSLLGSGLDQFYAKNPQIARGSERADQIAQERQGQLDRGLEAGRQAVGFTKQTKGYTDASGQFIPPTMPQAPSSKYGSGSVSFTDKPTRGTMTDPLTGKQVAMSDYLPKQSRIQDTKFGPMAGQEGGGAPAKLKPQAQQPKAPDLSGIDQIFPQQPSPSGGGASGLVGAGVTQGAPGGGIAPVDWYGGMETRPSAPYQMPPVYDIPQPKVPFGTNDSRFMPQTVEKFQESKVIDNGLSGNGPNLPGPMLPNYSPEQLEAFKAIDARGPVQNVGKPIAPSKLRFDFTNYFPGNDYAYLQKLFPGKSAEQVLSLVEKQKR